jgi:predicted nucleic acid-binding protein
VVKAVIDSNILIDYLHGIAPAAAEIALYANPSISIITWIEVLTGATAQNEKAVRQFLQTFTLLEIDIRVAEQAVVLRKSFGRQLRCISACWSRATRATLIQVIPGFVSRIRPDRECASIRPTQDPVG